MENTEVSRIPAESLNVYELPLCRQKDNWFWRYLYGPDKRSVLIDHFLFAFFQ